MRRRQYIRRKFRNDLRYFTPPAPPGGGRVDDETIKKIQQWVQDAAQQGTAGEAKKTSTPATERPVGKATPQDQVVREPPPDVQIGVRDRLGNIRIFSLDQVINRALDFLPNQEGGHVHLDTHTIMEAWFAGLESLMSEGTLPSLLQQADHLPPIAIRIPQGERGQAVFETIVRLLKPLDMRFQDGLKALLANPQFQQLFQGDKLTQGATSLLPNHQLVGILLPQGLLTTNPELVRALLVAQGLPPALIQNIPDRALAAVLQSLLTTSQVAAKNPLFFLQSIASALTAAGIPVQQVQNLLLALAGQAQRVGLPAGGEVSPEALQRWAARLFAANNPQLLGLNQLVQENFGQGITKILNSFIRVFFGGAILQSQLAWPQAVPNERLLAELGGLFSRRGESPEGGSKKRASRKKKSRRVEEIEGPDYRRVERKEDIADEPPLPPQMASVFIDVDSEDN